MAAEGVATPMLREGVRCDRLRGFPARGPLHVSCAKLKARVHTCVGNNWGSWGPRAPAGGWFQRWKVLSLGPGTPGGREITLPGVKGLGIYPPLKPDVKGLRSAEVTTPTEPGEALGLIADLYQAWKQLGACLPLATAPRASCQPLLAALVLLVPIWQRDRRPLRACSLALATLLADTAPGQLRLYDAECLAAGLLVPAVREGLLGLPLVGQALGHVIARLVHDTLEVGKLLSEPRVLDDATSRMVRARCLQAFDLRASVVEVALRYQGLSDVEAARRSTQISTGVEVLELHAPLARTLGLGAIAEEMESQAFRWVYPSSFSQTEALLHRVRSAGEEALRSCCDRLQQVASSDPTISTLVADIQLNGRIKSLSSVMRKVVAKSSWEHWGWEGVTDWLGLRVVLLPRQDIPEEEAELQAVEACYRLRDLSAGIWDPIPGRSKDYIATPKPSGYQSLHLTVKVEPPRVDSETLSEAPVADGALNEATTAGPSVELQFRTAHKRHLHGPGRDAQGGIFWEQDAIMSNSTNTLGMHEAALSGAASHEEYKGGGVGMTGTTLRAWKAAVRRVDGGTAGLPALASALSQADPLDGPRDPALATLLRHWDRNGDGRIDEEELRQALSPLVGSAASMAAAEVMRLWASPSRTLGASDLNVLLTDASSGGSSLPGYSGIASGPQDNPPGPTALPPPTSSPSGFSPAATLPSELEQLLTQHFRRQALAAGPQEPEGVSGEPSNRAGSAGAALQGITAHAEPLGSAGRTCLGVRPQGLRGFVTARGRRKVMGRESSRLHSLGFNRGMGASMTSNADVATGQAGQATNTVAIDELCPDGEPCILDGVSVRPAGTPNVGTSSRFNVRTVSDGSEIPQFEVLVLGEGSRCDPHGPHASSPNVQPGGPATLASVPPPPGVLPPGGPATLASALRPQAEAPRGAHHGPQGGIPSQAGPATPAERQPEEHTASEDASSDPSEARQCSSRRQFPSETAVQRRENPTDPLPRDAEYIGSIPLEPSAFPGGGTLGGSPVPIRQSSHDSGGRPGRVKLPKQVGRKVADRQKRVLPPGQGFTVRQKVAERQKRVLPLGQGIRVRQKVADNQKRVLPAGPGFPVRSTVAGARGRVRYGGKMKLMREWWRAHKCDTWALVPVVPSSDLGGGKAAERLNKQGVICLPRLGHLLVGGEDDGHNDVVLDVASVSGRHARLELCYCGKRGRVVRCVLTDLHSLNGVWLNRARLRPGKDVEVRPNDIIYFGEQRVAFRLVALLPDNFPTAISVALAHLRRILARDLPATLHSNSPRRARRRPDAAETTASCVDGDESASHEFGVDSLSRQNGADSASRLYGNDSMSHQNLEQEVMRRPADGRAWLELAEEEHRRALSGEGGTFAIARIYYHAAADMAESAAADPWAGICGLRSFAAQAHNPDAAELLVLALQAWGLAEVVAGHVPAGRRLLRRALEIAEKHPGGLLGGGGTACLLAWAKAERDICCNPFKALSLVEECLAADPANASALTLKALAAMDLSRFSTASSALKEAALASFPCDQTLAASSALEEAVLASSPCAQTLAVAGARLEALQGNEPGARGYLETLQQARARDGPRSGGGLLEEAEILRMWGEVEARLGNAGAARNLFRQATEIAEAPGTVWRGWADMEARLGNAEVAWGLYVDALKRAPGDAVTLVALAKMERTCGDEATAVRHFKQALLVQPRNVEAAKELAMLTGSGQLPDDGRVVAALPVAKTGNKKGAQRGREQPYLEEWVPGNAPPFFSAKAAGQ